MNKGWRHIHTAPRDGTHVWVIEPSSYGVFRASYRDPCFWAEDGGDLWPSHPSHWKPFNHIKPEHPGEEFYRLPHIRQPWRSNMNDPETTIINDGD